MNSSSKPWIKFSLQPKKNLIIAIDGPAGSGKSTTAHLLAKRLSYSYLDTGARYRALTWKALRDKIDIKSRKALSELAKKTQIELKSGPNLENKVYLDKQDITS
ncbi:MAG: (d)CMP kinase, partial [Candidatus Aminicenantes bacterium]|nr:(d)CMP kinase [Candidatus Aminicenantes bacterium]